MIEIKCVVSGKVQGVGYRDYVCTAAGECGVVGWVRNEADGTVQVCAQGTPDNLKALIEYLHEGSVVAEVVGVAVEWRASTVLYDGFGICR